MGLGLTSSALGSLQKGIDQESGAVGASTVVGFNKFREAFHAQVVGAGTNNVKVSAVTSTVENTRYQRGSIEQTRNKLDTAIDGDGLFVGRDNAGNIVYSRQGDWRPTEDGTFVNAAGVKLLAWKLDNEGNLPVVTNDVAALSTVSLQAETVDARPTSNVRFGFNLAAEQLSVTGAGILAKINEQSLNRSTGTTNIIVPFSNASGSLRVGDKFTMQTGTAVNSDQFTYGGFATSYDIGARAIFGATTTNQRFTVNTTGAAIANQVQEGSQITIQVDGEQAVTFTVKQSPTTDYEFNSLDTLANKLNKLQYITTNLQNNRFYMAAKDANKGIVFGTGAGTDLPSALGLTNVAATAGVEKRFATMAGLRSQINTVTGLDATLVNGALQMGAESAKESMTFNIQAAGINTARKATIGDGTAAHHRNVRVEAPNSGLKKGDFVRISGFNANAGNAAGVSVDNGLYMVTNADTNANYFEISARENTNVVGGSVSALSGTSQGFTWQKVAGRLGTEVLIPGGTDVATTIGNGGNVTIDGGAIVAGYAGANLENNDIVYMSGFETANGVANSGVAAGYYKVIDATGPTVLEYLSQQNGANAAVAGPTPNGFTIQKVGEVDGAGAASAMDTMPISIGAAANADTTVDATIYIPNHNYKVGDRVSFGELTGNSTITVNQADIEPDTYYKITAADSAAGTVQIKLGRTVGAPSNAATVGYAGWGDNGGAYAVAAATSLGNTAYVNNFTGFFNALNVNDSKRMIDQTDADKGAIKALDVSYDPIDPSKNIAGGRMPKDKVKVQSMQVYDSLGVLHSLNIGFAKIAQNRWAVEVYGTLDSNDEYDFNGPGLNIPVESGEITFDGGGNIASDTISTKVINLDWKNGANPSAIKLDFGNPGASTVQQVGKTYDTRFISSDGYGFGILRDISISEKGDVIGHFSNGTERSIYRIPVATFANLNGLQDVGTGMLISTGESGRVILKEAGRGGVAVISSSALSDSNVDKTESMLQVMDLSSVYQMNASLISKQEQNDQALVRAMG